MATLFEPLEDCWKQFLPDFDYIYNNLRSMPDEQAEAVDNHFLAASLLALKHSFEKEWLEQNALKMLVLTSNAPMGLQKSFIVYLFGRSELKEGKIIEILASSPTTLKDTIMSTLDIYIEKGRKENEEKKNYEFVKNLLLAGRFTSAEIANFASVSEEFVEKVRTSL